jgi:hypothetical protein
MLKAEAEAEAEGTNFLGRGIYHISLPLLTSVNTMGIISHSV